MTSVNFRGLRGALTLLCSALLALMCSCGTDTEPVETSLAATAGANSLNLDQQVPSPADLARLTSVIETGSQVGAASFRSDFASRGVTKDGKGCIFNPLGGGSSRLSSAAFCIYTLDYGSLDGEGAAGFDIFLDCPGALGDGSVRVFAGIAPFGQKGWAWQEMLLLPYIEQDNLRSGYLGRTQSSTAGPHYLNVCILVFGEQPLPAAQIELRQSADLAAGPVVFRKGWDGTVKGREAFDDSLSVVGDGQGNVFASVYDSSCGELDVLQLRLRAFNTEAVDCDADVGLTNELILDPQGDPILTYYDAELMDGAVRKAMPGAEGKLVWSPRSNFDDGDDGSGLPPADVGRHSSAVFDSQGSLHIFHEDSSSGRIKHAVRPIGSMEWQTDYVTSLDQISQSPIAVLFDGDVCCLHISRPLADPEARSLAVAFPIPDSWGIGILAEDVANPLAESERLGFCDGSVRPTDGALLAAYSSKTGPRICTCSPGSFVASANQLIVDSPGSGAFLNMCMMADGSVRLAEFNETLHRISFATGDEMSENFTLLPAVQFSMLEWCDDLDLWVDPQPDPQGLHDAVLFTLSCYEHPLEPAALSKFRHRGHVTLMK